MEFGWINLFGAGIVLLMMIPNIIYAAGPKQDKTQIKAPHYLSACEQVGRAASSCLEIWLWKCGRIPDLSDWKRGIIAVLLFVLDILLEKKELIKCDGAGYYSNRDISSIGHAAPTLAVGSVCNSFWSQPLYDHIRDS